MNHENMEPHEVMSQVIEDLAEAEGRMRTARDKMSDSFLASGAGYESIAAYIDSALASAGAALAEVHNKLHEP